jgi:hypothetical protein
MLLATGRVGKLQPQRGRAGHADCTIDGCNRTDGDGIADERNEKAMKRMKKKKLGRKSMCTSFWNLETQDTYLSLEERVGKGFDCKCRARCFFVEGRPSAELHSQERVAV